MRQMLAFVLLTSLSVGVSGSASGQNVPQHEHDAAIAALAAQIKTVLNADSVLGTPREFDGMKIVPIVNIFFGFGAGTGVSEERERAPGIGGGGGGGVTPVGLLVITKDKEVRVVAAKVGALSEVLKAAIPEILEFMRGKRERADRGAER
jgi:uncharacterized spore protein YtfJ